MEPKKTSVRPKMQPKGVKGVMVEIFMYFIYLSFIAWCLVNNIHAQVFVGNLTGFMVLGEQSLNTGMQVTIHVYGRPQGLW